MLHDAQRRAMVLMDEGRAHLDAGRLKQAELCFRTAAQTHTSVHALNNWALSRYLSKAYADTLHILEPVLASSLPAPYTRALASLAQTALGERAAADRLVQQAVRDFDAGLADARKRGGVTEAAWVEYASLITKAAGTLGHHRLVLDLHRRWPGRNSPADAFYAGVAAFNLGRYAQAATCWRGITQREWARHKTAYARVADLTAQELVPPFELDYDLDASSENDPSVPSEVLAARGSVRVRMLALAFDEAGSETGSVIASLIMATGDWGVDLGQRLLRGSSVPMPLKSGAARALTEAGIFKPDQPIPIFHQGKHMTVVTKQVEICAQAPELDGVVAEAVRLRDSGQKDEALRLLGEMQGARGLLESLERIAPDHPAVLFNLAGLWLQLGNLNRARSYAKRIDPAGTTPEFQKLLADLKDRLTVGAVLSRLPVLGAMPDSMRLEAEEKPISLEISLAAALKQIPVQWLNAAAALYQTPPAARRPERERSLAAVLKEPDRLRRMLDAEGPPVRAGLRGAESGGRQESQGSGGPCRTARTDPSSVSAPRATAPVKRAGRLQNCKGLQTKNRLGRTADSKTRAPSKAPGSCPAQKSDLRR